MPVNERTTGPNNPHFTPRRVRSRRGALSSTSGTAAIPIRILRRPANFSNSVGPSPSLGNHDGRLRSSPNFTLTPTDSGHGMGSTAVPVRGECHSSPLNLPVYSRNAIGPGADGRPVSPLTGHDTISLHFGSSDPITVSRRPALGDPPAASNDHQTSLRVPTVTQALPTCRDPPGQPPILPGYVDYGGGGRPAYDPFAGIEPAQHREGGVAYAMSAPAALDPSAHDRSSRTPRQNDSFAGIVGGNGVQDLSRRNVENTDNSDDDITARSHSPRSGEAPLLASPDNPARGAEQQQHAASSQQRQRSGNDSPQRADHDSPLDGRRPSHFEQTHGSERGPNDGPTRQLWRSATGTGWEEARVGGVEWWVRRIRECDRGYALAHELARRTEELVEVRGWSWWYAVREVERELLGERRVMGG